MAASSALSRSLRLASRNIYKASKHDLQHPSLCFSRHFSRRHQSNITKVEARNTWSMNYKSDITPLEFFTRPGAVPSVTSRVWLRDACTCDRCVDPHSGQKRFSSHEVPSELPVQYISETAETLQVFWKNDFFTKDVHFSEYPRILWQGQPNARRPPLPQEKLWTRDRIMDFSPFFAHQDIMTDGPAYRQVLNALSQLGIVILRDVPSEEDAVLKLAERLGCLQETFYGKSWDVIAKPNAENIAYTSSALGLHQDMLYLRNAPRIQLLHCLENSVTGGESIFSDGFNAANRFRYVFPDLVKAFTHRKVVYKYDKGGNIYRASRAVLSKVGLYWSPRFQDPIQLDPMTPESMSLYSQWIKAATRLEAIMSDPESIIEYKLKPGECVIFDNRRILHGRRAFDPSSGARHLKGAYVEDDSFNSKLKSLEIAFTSDKS